MGEVFLAEDARLGRRVAVKFVPNEVGAHTGNAERLFREARAASALNHPNIVTIFDIGETDAGRFMTMELVSGRTLRDYMSERPALNAVVEVILQSARALACAHAAGIVHRDIKPENIMVRGDGYVKVVDFGLAKSPQILSSADVTGPLETSGATAAHLVVGTVRYMSPEQLAAQPLSAASDIFSLGLVLYELLTLQHPFGQESALGHMAALASQVAVAPSRHAPHIPRALDDLVLAMLGKEAGLRPTADATIAALVGLTGPATVADSLTPARRAVRPSVGRGSERRTLARLLHDAPHHPARLALISAEAGMGKTTLVEDFLSDTAADARARIGRGRCSERLAGTGAYLPFIEAIQSLMAAGDAATTHLVKTLAPSWYAQVVSLTSGDGVAPPVPIQAERMKRELTALLEELSRNQPVVLSIDDLHWVDASSVDLLSYVLNRRQLSSVLIVGTCRPTEVTTGHPFAELRLDAIARGSCIELKLETLGREEVDACIGIAFPRHALPSEFCTLIYRRTEGHPLFIADLLRYLSECGAVVETDGVWTLTESLESIEGMVPLSVQSMVARKLEQLAEDDRKLLVAASVQGEEFDVAVLSAAIGADAADVEERLEPLERLRGVVRLVREEELPNHTVTARYRFAHALYQNVLYASLRPARRTALSRSVAEALLLCYAARAQQIAAHVAILFEAARDFDRAAQHFLAASTSVLHLGAWSEAMILARRGIAILQHLPAGEDRDRLELALRLALGGAMHSATGVSDDMIAEYGLARRVAERLGQQQAMFQVLVRNVWMSIAGGLCGQALASAHESLRQAEAMHDDACLACAHLQVAVTSNYVGDPRTAAAHAAVAIDFADRSDHDAMLGLLALSPVVFARSELAHSLFMSGRFAESFVAIDDALVAARRVGHTTTTGLALLRKQNLSFRRGRVAEGGQAVEEFVRAQEQQRSTQAIWVPLLQGRFEGLREGGSIDTAVGAINQSISISLSVGFRTSVSAMHQILAEILTRHGRLDDAALEVAKGIEAAYATGELMDVPELLRMKADIMLKQPGRTAETSAQAEALLRDAIRMADEHGAGYWGLRATSTLAEHLAATERANEACRLLTERCASFDGDDSGVPDLDHARRLLAGLNGDGPNPPS